LQPRAGRAIEGRVKDRLFIPLATLIAAGMIAGALSPLLARPGAPVDGVADGEALLFSLADLSQLAGARGFAVMAPPGRVAGQEGVRLAAEPTQAPGAEGDGARLVLGASARQRLQGGPVTLVMVARALPQTDTKQTSVGLVSASGPVAWVRGEVSADFAPVVIELPAPSGAPLALAFWPAVNGEGRGIEIKELRLYGSAQ
jgi:hypothetical protein